ncbi:MAG TPA: SUMF1/EgtB/PvdO family nonheme iron enzyme [Spirochaetota bacterium]|nr:MAG: Serine/threonine-protein kinase pkn1 [Spirochaetes bacterium ADurb.Bin133]HNZ28258.1 SUMF1/EgtB/PvdO family nonheme iron enzyme [Spirochaetota bacterium]HPY88183.1 SUMF1/EgtB/PvdO family nonheme iron enzyme [Spirochaetota bacterium]HQB61204.1 SUMF1/EgtB/PvdO family nonheme iron enzyme [Spirochaetota bacterium]
MKKNIMLTLLLLFGVFLNSTENTKTRVAILNFTPKGVEPILAEAIVENLTTSIINTSDFNVIERNQLDKLMKELNLQNSDDFNDKLREELGNLHGVKLVILGSVTKIGSTITINMRGVEVSTGLAKFAKSITTKNEDEIPGLIQNLAILVFTNDGLNKTKNVVDKNSSVNNKTPSVSADMIFVQGGEFIIGSTGKKLSAEKFHSVTVSSFWIGKYEVTQKEWKSIMNDNPSRYKNDDRPVERVSWLNAIEFCNKKSEKEGLTKVYSIEDGEVKFDIKANGYRLPTEAEWEYAARGGKNNKKYKFSGSENIGEVAVYNKNSDDKTSVVGTKKPNDLGIYDMTGNVREWCWDYYDRKYYKDNQIDPQGPVRGSKRVVRGGSYSKSKLATKVSYRDKRNKNYCKDDLGFRLVRNDY